MLAGYNIAHHVGGRKRRRVIGLHIDPFDQKYGTETSGIREIGSLDVTATTSARFAVRYQPSDGAGVRSALESLEIDYGDYSFIDFGSGKGRVLLVAAGFPFKEVIGIEFSRELHEIASQNIGRFPPEAVRAGVIRTVHGDAAAFTPPPNNLVCYLYNPFGLPIISLVVQRLLAHYELGYRVIVIYVDPQHRMAFEGTEKFIILNETPQILTMTTLPQANADHSRGKEIIFS